MAWFCVRSSFRTLIASQYNLFAGTILGCAGEDQLSILDDMQARGQLGCFALTEKFAGVNSGLVVETEIEWDAGRRVFVLNTPSDGARKNWISQGFVADKAVVIANLTIGGQRVGPHAFTMDFRNDKGTSRLFVCVAHCCSCVVPRKNSPDSTLARRVHAGELVKGVHVEDMGIKSVGNDLDNAAIRFDNVELPYSALLNRFARIDVDGDGAWFHATQLCFEGAARLCVGGPRLLLARPHVCERTNCAHHCEGEHYANDCSVAVRRRSCIISLANANASRALGYCWQGATSCECPECAPST